VHGGLDESDAGEGELEDGGELEEDTDFGVGDGPEGWAPLGGEDDGRVGPLADDGGGEEIVVEEGGEARADLGGPFPVKPFGSDPASGLEIGDDGIVELEMDEGVARRLRGGSDEMDGAVGPIAENRRRFIDKLSLGETGAGDAMQSVASSLDGGPPEDRPFQPRFDESVNADGPQPHDPEEEPSRKERGEE
jgi:hypothetical protein